MGVAHEREVVIPGSPMDVVEHAGDIEPLAALQVHGSASLVLAVHSDHLSGLYVVDRYIKLDLTIPKEIGLDLIDVAILPGRQGAKALQEQWPSLLLLLAIQCVGGGQANGLAAIRRGSLLKRDANR